MVRPVTEGRGLGADGQQATPSRSLLSEGLRSALLMIASFAVLALGLGLFAINTTRDTRVADARAETELLAAHLLGERDTLLGDGAVGLLAEAVLTTDTIRAATVAIGEGSIVAVGPEQPAPPAERIAAAADAGQPLVETVGDTVRVTTAFARAEGAPVVLETVAPLSPPGFGWTGIAVTWAVVASGILAMSFLFERRRRDRASTLAEAVQALSARDVQVSRREQDLVRTKNDFVNAISQELRSPLQVIKGVASLLAQGGRLSDAQRDDLVAGLRLNADRLDGLMADLIDVDRLTQRTVPVRRREVEVRDVLDRVLDDVDTGQHTVDVAVGDVVAIVTPAHLERMLRSLLLNAVKYGPPGSTIHVHARRDGSVVTIGVDDEGPGVPVGDRFAIFEPLRQLANEPGMGLGLALVKRFAELHGGRAWVQEAPGGGAAFRLALPDEAQALKVDSWQLTAEVDEVETPNVGTP